MTSVDSTLEGDLTTPGQAVRKSQLQTALAALGSDADAAQATADAAQAAYTNSSILYVDPTNGDDDNNGQSPGAAFATIQAAYDAIPTVNGPPPTTGIQGGRIYLAPGRHDVGTGLVLKRGLACEFVSMIGNPVWRATTSGGAIAMPGAILYSSESTKPTALVELGLSANTESNSQSAYGFSFEGLIFELDEDTVYAIDAERWNMGRIYNCSAQHLDTTTTPNPYLVRNTNLNEGGADTSWMRLDNNWCSNMGIYKNVVANSNGLNHNNHQFTRNVAIQVGRTEAFITLQNTQGARITGNNFEGGSGATAAIGIEFETSTGGNGNKQNAIYANSGEYIDKFIVGDEFYANFVAETGDRIAGANNSVLIDLPSTATSHDNMILMPSISSFGNAYDNDGTAWNIDDVVNTVISSHNDAFIHFLPTSNPGRNGEWWNDGGTVKVSSG